MVMRGLSVPKAKRFYILKDAAREARLHKVPFGRVCDPVGPRCRTLHGYLALCRKGRAPARMATCRRHRHLEPGHQCRHRQWPEVSAWKTPVWTGTGPRRWLDDDGWRDRAEDNRNAMMEAGSWGVPSFMTENTIIWGQDRFAVIEACLLASPADDKG